MSSSDTEAGKISVAKEAKGKRKQVPEEKKKTVQKITNTVPTDKLDHLKMPVPETTQAVAWANATSFNALIADFTKVECYICGGPGHFMERCDLHLSLTKRFGGNGLRSVIYGRAVNNIKIKHDGHTL